MARLLTITLLLLCAFFVQSQQAYLFIKKGGHKKKVYVEIDRITLGLKNGTIVRGLITFLKEDTLFINGKPIPTSSVQSVILREGKNESFKIDGKTWLLISGGVVLTTLGLTASKQANFKQALTAGAVIGIAPILIYYLKSKISFKRKKFIIGKRFRLQVLDLHMPYRRGF